jgi:hypothetical protein
VIFVIFNQSGSSRGMTRKSRNREIELELSSMFTPQHSALKYTRSLAATAGLLPFQTNR